MKTQGLDAVLHQSRPRPRLALVQTTMPSYRDGFVQELTKQAPGIEIWVGQEHFDPTVQLSQYIASVGKPLRNLFFLRRRLLWQLGAFRAAKRADTTILELNPRILSNWALLAYRKLCGRRSVLWGHAWPRGGSRSRSAFLRRWMLQLADAGIAYTERDQWELSRYASVPIFLAANAVASRNIPLLEDTHPVNVIQIGRLVASKKPALTLDAWLKIYDRLDPLSCLVFVGDGPLRAELESSLQDTRAPARVSFVGEVTDRTVLAELFGRSFVSVSAGYAGLSVTESLSHGVPIVIADKEPHAPEVALATKKNSHFFAADSSDALADCILEIFRDRQHWIAKRREISSAALSLYSIEAMAQGFLAAARDP
jgi:glycosyltransferase involved in cell wall biosynthesis